MQSLPLSYYVSFKNADESGIEMLEFVWKSKSKKGKGVEQKDFFMKSADTSITNQQGALSALVKQIVCGTT